MQTAGVREVDIFQDPFAEDDEQENLHAAPAPAAVSALLMHVQYHASQY
jgi:hypothetical protein